LNENLVWVNIATINAPNKNIAKPTVFAITNKIPFPTVPSLDKTSTFGIILDGSAKDDLRRDILIFLPSSAALLRRGLIGCGDRFFWLGEICCAEFLVDDLTGEAPLISEYLIKGKKELTLSSETLIY
jgi:hypothetical protein